MRAGDGRGAGRQKENEEHVALTNEEILEAIKVKPALELAELVKMMEETFGVSAAAPVAVAAAGAPPPARPPPAEEKDTFDVVLTGCRRQQDPGHQGRPRAHPALASRRPRTSSRAPRRPSSRASTRRRPTRPRRKLEEAGATVELK